MNPQVHEALQANRRLAEEIAEARNDDRHIEENELVAFAEIAGSETWTHVAEQIAELQTQAMEGLILGSGPELFRWQGEMRVLEVLRTRYGSAREQLEASRKEAGE